MTKNHGKIPEQNWEGLKIWGFDILQEKCFPDEVFEVTEWLD